MTDNYLYLLYLVDGEPTSFPVDIEPSKTIADLKDAIKVKKAPEILTFALSAALALQAVNAQGPPDGKYLIVSATLTGPPPIPVGFNEQGGPTNPIVVGGSNNVWTITKSNPEEYQIILKEAGPTWLTQAGENEVFVSLMPPPPPPARWRLQKQQDNMYSIEAPIKIWPTKGWTLTRTEPGARVTVGIFEFPSPAQLWKLIPVLDE
ncbi:hypothetical protein BGX24_011803 [Mortierella sp. AD032]|nr:hypothetical protein BGX24_011803 [Mortierella sp. AD032]